MIIAWRRPRCLLFLSCGPVQIQLHRPLTFLVGENGSGKTTLLETIAARCASVRVAGAATPETDCLRRSR